MQAMTLSQKQQQEEMRKREKESKRQSPRQRRRSPPRARSPSRSPSPKPRSRPREERTIPQTPKKAPETLPKPRSPEVQEFISACVFFNCLFTLQIFCNDLICSLRHSLRQRWISGPQKIKGHFRRRGIFFKRLVSAHCQIRILKMAKIKQRKR